MPLYFFDIVDGESLPDRHGLELENIDEARAHAMGIAMSFLKQPSSEVWRDNLWSVTIREAVRGRLYRLDVQVTQDAASQ